MPNQYTKEQIDEAHARIRGIREISAVGGKPTHDETLMLALGSALSTAEDDLEDAKNRRELANMAAENLEEQRDALKARCAELEARMQSAGWISVEERLPDKETESCSVDCIICEEDGYQTLAYRYYGKLNEDNDNVWYDRVFRRNITGTVTHWMPLPEPPAIVGKKEG